MPLVEPAPSTPLPTPPSTTDIANFDSRADAFNLALQDDLQPEMNALASATYQNAVYANERAQTASAHADDAADKRDEAQGYRDQAAAAALTALNGPGTSGTSATALTIAPGPQTFASQPGKAWVVGQPVIVSRTSAPGTTRMSGTITAYNTGTGPMTVLVDTILGVGTFSDWTIGLGTARAPDALPIQIITVNTAAVPGIHYVIAAANVTLTLPAVLPAKDLAIAFTNSSQSFTPAVDFNGTKLRGQSPGVMALDNFNARTMLQSTGNAL